jgi:hypothetical protein
MACGIRHEKLFAELGRVLGGIELGVDGAAGQTWHGMPWVSLDPAVSCTQIL